MLARFLTSKSHFAPTKGRVKSAAFLPGPDGTVSLYAIQGLSELSAWEIGDRLVGSPGGRRIRARADLVSSEVLAPLRVIRDNDPPRHRSLAGWPPDPSEQLLLALHLANTARLTLRPMPAA